MTIATNAGLKVGNYYKVIEDFPCLGIKKGAILKFIKDDESSFPLFYGKSNVGKEFYMSVTSVSNVPVKETPALKAGLIVGKKYKIIEKDGNFPEGSKVKFIEDDGSGVVRFRGIDTQGNKTEYYLIIDLDIKLPKQRKEM